MDNDLKKRATEIREEIEELEKKIEALKEEEKQIALYVINKEKGTEGILTNIEEDILSYDENKSSTYFAKYIEESNIKLFVCLNKLNKESEDRIKSIIDLLSSGLVTGNVDERYIKILSTAKKLSEIVDNGASFTLIAIDNNKTYAFAEGKANIYEYDNGVINILELTNTIGELSYEVINNNDYIRLIVFSYSSIEDLNDEKIKIITKKTNREELIKAII